MSIETIVRLKITSAEHDPTFISNIIGIPYDRCWRIGDLRPKTTIHEKANGWILGSGLSKTTSLEEHLKTLLLRVMPSQDRLLNLLADDQIEISCVIYADSPPALNFEKKIISDISALGASLDIDLYL